MIFDAVEYSRQNLPLISAYLWTISSLTGIIALLFAWDYLGAQSTWLMIIAAAIYVFSSVEIIRRRSSVVERRRIRTQIDRLLGLFEYQLDSLKVNDSCNFNRSEQGIIQVTRRSRSVWNVRVFKIGTGTDSRPVFEVDAQRFRMTLPDNPGEPLMNTVRNRELVSSIYKVVSSAAHHAGVLTFMPLLEDLDEDANARVV